jgi:hypothetical protein
MSIPRRETGYLGNTKVCPVVLAAREELFSANVVPVRVNLPAFVYIAFERTLLNFALAVFNCTIALHAAEVVEAGSVTKYAFPLLCRDFLFFFKGSVFEHGCGHGIVFVNWMRF